VQRKSGVLFVGGKTQVWVTLVITQKDIKTRAQPLDEVVFEQQGLNLTPRPLYVDVCKIRHHQPRFIILSGLIEIA
jgi:hypothetical protein